MHKHNCMQYIYYTVHTMYTCFTEVLCTKYFLKIPVSEQLRQVKDWGIIITESAVKHVRGYFWRVLHVYHVRHGQLAARFKRLVKTESRTVCFQKLACKVLTLRLRYSSTIFSKMSQFRESRSCSRTSTARIACNSSCNSGKICFEKKSQGQ